MTNISLIVAAGEYDGVIGRDNDLPFSKNLSPDKKFFADTTAGHPVIMGRRTLESVPAKYLPLDRDRITILLSTTVRNDYMSGIFVARTMPEAIAIAAMCPGSDEIFIAGGVEVYKAGLRFATRIYKTLVDEQPAGDTYFPDHPEISHLVSSCVLADFVPRLTFNVYER